MKQFRIAATWAVAVLLVSTVPAWAQSAPPTCGEYAGVVCDGWFTDDAGVVSAEEERNLEGQIGELVAEFGNQVAFVIVQDTPPGTSPAQFAVEIGNAWGVGTAGADDGIVLLVSLDDRRTELADGGGISLPGDEITSAGNSFFADGEFGLGAAVIVERLRTALTDLDSPDSDGSDNGVVAPPVVVDPPSDDGSSLWPGFAPTAVGLTLFGGVLAAGGVAVYRDRRRRREREREKRAERIDAALALLEATGQELPRPRDYSLSLEGAPPAATTADSLEALDQLAGGTAPSQPLVHALAHVDLVQLFDLDRLLAESEVPLELRASTERPLLEQAVQDSATAALEVPYEHTDAFEVALAEVHRIVETLRPHRVAAARRRVAQEIATRATSTEAGYALVTDRGERFHRAGPALDPAATVADSVEEMESAYATAVAKSETMTTLYERLPSSSARPAVAAALADVTDDPDTAYAEYERVRTELERLGDALESDGLVLPAIAALLLLNHDEANVAEFVDAYDANRNRGFRPQEAVEYALAGLKDRREVDFVRREAERLSLPISITAALLRRRDDGPEVFEELMAALVDEDITGDTRRTIAGILAISLEPTQAMRRWLEARRALAALGLVGAYADVAAAFGASDPRGPRAFALAYAAQRQALARSGISDADRFAPELAHAGTSGQKDSWTGEPIPGRLGSFDPFTLLFYHWVITRGHSGSFGWEPVYRDTTWSGNRGSWWGGGGGFGSSGGSSWGGSSWGGGGFGGFGGGGGFSAGGGSGW